MSRDWDMNEVIERENVFLRRHTRRLESFIKRLGKLAEEAEKLDLRLGNGAIVSSLLGGIVDDLEGVS